MKGQNVSKCCPSQNLLVNSVTWFCQVNLQVDEFQLLNFGSGVRRLTNFKQSWLKDFSASQMLKNLQLRFSGECRNMSGNMIPYRNLLCMVDN